MTTQPIIEYEDYPIIVGNMWAELAKTIHGQVGDVYIDKGPVEAMRFAQCAEACYWKAQGEDASTKAEDIIAASMPNKE